MDNLCRNELKLEPCGFELDLDSFRLESDIFNDPNYKPDRLEPDVYEELDLDNFRLESGIYNNLNGAVLDLDNFRLEFDIYNTQHGD